MQKLLKEYLDELNKRQKKSRKVAIAALLLVVMVVGSVAGILAQYGVAMTGTEKCGLEEHTHSEECDTKVLSCSLDESEGHTHTEECLYPGELVCSLEENEEHTHREECYQRAEGFSCGLEEEDGHIHTEECYTTEPGCGKEEHIHTDICYIDTEADVEGQEVWDRQYAGTEWKDIWGEDLVTAARTQLGYQESINNYTVTEAGNHKGYTRYGQFAGDVYADWDAAFVNFCIHYAGLRSTGLFPETTDTALWKEDFCNRSAENATYLVAAEGYEPSTGDLAFFRKEGEEPAVRMGIVASCEEGTIRVIEGNCQNEVRENEYGTGDGRITDYLKITELEATYKADGEETPEEMEETSEEPEEMTEAAETTTEEPEDSEDLAEGEEPVKAGENLTRTMSVEGEDYTVTVNFTEEAQIPEDAILDVREIAQDSEEYESYYVQSLEAMGVEELSFARYFDVTFLTAGGEELEPAAPVEVKISYGDSVELNETESKNAVHFAENPEEGTKVPEILEAGFDAEEKSFSFTQNSFSVTGTVEGKVFGDIYGTTTLANEEEKIYSRMDIRNVDDLLGKEFLLAAEAPWGEHYLMGRQATQESRGGVAGISFAGGDSVNTAAYQAGVWYLEKLAEPEFAGFPQGYSIKNGNGQYLTFKNNALSIGTEPYEWNVFLQGGKLTIQNFMLGTILGLDGGPGSGYFTTGVQSDLIVYVPEGQESRPEALTQVPSLDTGEKIRIRMVKFDGKAFSGYDYTQNEVDNPDVKQGILSNRTNADEYPGFAGSEVSCSKTFAELFADAKPAKGLFLKEKFDQTGEYSYDSSMNGARFDEKTGQFILYEELTTVGAGQSKKEWVTNRGNFLPYDTFYGKTESGLENLYTLEAENKGDGLLTEGDRKYKWPLYLPDKVTPTYDFGMELTTDFYQMQNGLVNGKSMKYEFTGDDDLWVYIDGVLVLDLGGSHDARSGWIDFSTGEVYEQGIGTTTIYQRFLTAYGTEEAMKAAGIEWKDTGNGKKIFGDYSKHKLQMWYMERGGGASNLRVKFNLPLIPPGEVQVEKRLSNTEQEQYANVKFKFQIFLQPLKAEYEEPDPNKEDIFDDNAKPENYRLLNAWLLEQGRTNATVFILPEGETEEVAYPVPEDGIFELRPGDKLMIRGLKSHRKYYVRELGIDTAEYSGIEINGVNVTYEDNEETGKKDGEIVVGNGYVDTITRSVKERAYLLFTNQCSMDNSRDLQITKQMTPGQISGDSFSYQVHVVQVKNQKNEETGNLEEVRETVPYSGKYYRKNKDGYYYQINEETKEVTLSKVSGDIDQNTPGLSTADGIMNQVRVGDTVIIKGFLAGTEFSVEEGPLGEEYNMPKLEDASILENSEESYTPVEGNTLVLAKGAVILGKDAKVMVTNSLKDVAPQDIYNWEIIKKSSTEGGLPLENAVFELKSKKQSNPPEVYYGRSDSNGKLRWFDGPGEAAKLLENVPAGEYTLKELEAPKGYVLSMETWNLEIKDTNEITVTISGSDRKVDDILRQNVTEDKTTGAKTTDVVLTFYNDIKIYELPDTGGSGTWWYLISGTLLMLTAALILYKNKRGEVLGS